MMTSPSKCCWLEFNESINCLRCYCLVSGLILSVAAMDIEFSIQRTHRFLQRELDNFVVKIRQELLVLKRLRRNREVAFEQFKKEINICELRVMIVADRFSALYLQVAAFDEEVNQYLEDVSLLSSPARTMWFGSIARRFLCMERVYECKSQVWDSVNEVSKQLAELLIVHDYLVSGCDRLYCV